MGTIQVSSKNSLRKLSPPSLLSALGKDRIAVLNHLQLYKERGQPNYPAILQIPLRDRIPALVKYDDIGYNQVLEAITAALNSAVGNLNLRVGVNEDQVLDIAESIITEAEEDQLSLEDVLLFLQQLSLGKAGKIFDRMDMPTFFELFETYREARYQTVIGLREEQQCQYKGLGDTNRTSDELAKKDWQSARDLLIAKYDIDKGTDQQVGGSGAA